MQFFGNASISLLGFGLLGWLAGGLINYMGDVLPRTRRFSPVLCYHCAHAFRWHSYLLMRPCANCGARRGMRAWIVQILAVTAIALSGAFPMGRLGPWLGLLVLAYFGVVALIDLEHRLIMHPVSLVGAGIGLLVGLTIRGWQSALLGGLAGFGVMFGVYLLGALFVRWMNRLRSTQIEEEAFGFGDVALSGVMGLMLGWPGIIAGLFLAVLIGGAGSLLVILYTLLTKRYHSNLAIPYGPFLIIAALILLFRPPS